MKIGVLGLGSTGSRHARNLQAMGHEVMAFDPNRKVRPPGIEMYPRADILAGADALVIASPTKCHFDDLLFCMDSGKPIFIEKPVAASESEWRNLKRYQSVGRIFVGYNLRFHQCVIQAKRWLDGGLIGKPLWASFTCAQFNDRPAYLRDGVIRNWSHEIDLALYLLGPARVAAAVARMTDGNDDIADIVLKHDNGCQTNIHLDYLAKPEQRRFAIGGNKDVLTCCLLSRTAAVEGAVRLSDGGREIYQSRDTWDSNYIYELRAFIDRIEGKDVPGATGEDGMAALDICLQARRMAGLV